MAEPNDQPAKAPNVLVIVTDQQRADHMGFGGNDVVRTPNLDALAARSTVFDRAFVANPVCAPNRATMLTGRMPSVHGLIFNDRSLEWGANTFVRRLRAAGYQTALIGKSHLQVGLDRHLLPPNRREPSTHDGHPDAVYGYEEPERYLTDDFDDPDDFYGFGHVEFTLDHGARAGGHHLRWALERGGDIDELVVPYSDQAPGDLRSDRWWQIYRPPYDPELHSTNFVAERTSAFITDAHATGEPWMAWASFPDPHHPMTPPGDWFHRHNPHDMEVPASFDDPLTGAPAHVTAIRNREPLPFWPFPFGTSDPGLVREALAATYGMIEYIDEAVGRIMATLADVGATEDTIVVFTSDHGDLMGDHGLMLKGNLHYEGVTRVPLTISAPGHAPARTTALASSLDLAPTVLELCDISRFDGMQGTSLAPALDGDAAVRDALLIEDDMPHGLAGALQVPPKLRTLVTADHRYSRDSTGAEQLFDLGDDPLELHDLSHTATGVRDHHRDLMLELMLDLSNTAGAVPHERSTA